MPEFFIIIKCPNSQLSTNSILNINVQPCITFKFTYRLVFISNPIEISHGKVGYYLKFLKLHSPTHG